jgi:hypothetical protein
VLLFAIGEAMYQEWNRWAPHDPPELLVEPWDWQGLYGLTLRVTNQDVDGRFRAYVTGITAPRGGPLDFPAEHPFPWTLVWTDNQAVECSLVRGESAIIPLVRFDHQAAVQLVNGHRRQTGNPYPFLFPGPKGDQPVWAFLETTRPQSQLEVHVQIVRSDPQSGLLEKTLTVEFPRRGLWRARYIPDG